MKDPRPAARMMVQHDPDCLEDLWLRYWANGGTGDKFELDAYLHGLIERDPFDQKILAWALHDLSRRR
jgi:hypothetical protein